MRLGTFVGRILVLIRDCIVEGTDKHPSIDGFAALGGGDSRILLRMPRRGDAYDQVHTVF